KGFIAYLLYPAQGLEDFVGGNIKRGTLAPSIVELLNGLNLNILDLIFNLIMLIDSTLYIVK
ncbi:MAG: hypothetical protein JSV40_11685, partial [Deltaproteobacteria bacterium]